MEDYTTALAYSMSTQSSSISGVSESDIKMESAIAGKNRGIARERSARTRSYAAALAFCAAA